jgi:hypothetical protein
LWVENLGLWYVENGACLFPLHGGDVTAGLELSRETWNDDERRVYERLESLFEQERLRMVRALASGPLFGQKEFEVRDQVHNRGAKALEATADERQKKGGIRWS